METAIDTVGESGHLADPFLEKLARDVKAIDVVEGTQQVQRHIVARHVIGEAYEASARATLGR